MTLEEAQREGDRRWPGVFGRAWHMFPTDPEQEYCKLEWPDGVIRGIGKTFEEAFAAADTKQERGTP